MIHTAINQLAIVILSFLSARVSSFLLVAPHHIRVSATGRQTLFRSMMTKRESPSGERNKGPIWEVLESKVFSSKSEEKEKLVLEIAAGPGVHMEHFTTKLASLGVQYQWFPTDPDPAALSSIQARMDENAAILGNMVKSPMKLTLNENGIQENVDLPKALDVVININMIHISPWEATLGLMKAASEYLKSGGFLYLYGPYRVNGNWVESNRRFSESLQAMDPSYGVRDLEKVIQAAEEKGFTLVSTIDMPTNNLSVILQKK